MGGKGKEYDREICGTAIWKQKSKKPDTAGGNWRDSSRTRKPGKIMLVAYAPEGATKARLTDNPQMYKLAQPPPGIHTLNPADGFTQTHHKCSAPLL